MAGQLLYVFYVLYSYKLVPKRLKNNLHLVSCLDEPHRAKVLHYVYGKHKTYEHTQMLSLIHI